MCHTFIIIDHNTCSVSWTERSL